MFFGNMQRGGGPGFSFTASSGNIDLNDLIGNLMGANMHAGH